MSLHQSPSLIPQQKEIIWCSQLLIEYKIISKTYIHPSAIGQAGYGEFIWLILCNV